MARAESFAVVAPGREHHASWFKLIDNPDANLIAAAPELLDALKDSIGHLEEIGQDLKWHPIGHCPVLDKCRAAVVKATSTPRRP